MNSCVNFMLNNSGLILCACLIVFVLSMALERNNWLTIIAFISFALSAAFVLLTIVACVRFDILLTTQLVIPYKVNNLSSNSAEITYSLDSVLKEDTYYGPVKLDANAQKPTVLIEKRRNRIGDEEIVLKQLTVPLNLISN